MNEIPSQCKILRVNCFIQASPSSAGEIASWFVHRIPYGLAEGLQQGADPGAETGRPRL